LSKDINTEDYIQYLSSVLASLSIQTANGSTKAELKRPAQTALRHLGCWGYRSRSETELIARVESHESFSITAKRLSKHGHEAGHALVTEVGSYLLDRSTSGQPLDGKHDGELLAPASKLMPVSRLINRAKVRWLRPARFESSSYSSQLRDHGLLVNQQLLLQNEYLVAENRILKVCDSPVTLTRYD